MNTIPVIMAGGSGTRLWPLSRGMYPKQFLQLVGETSLFQQACERAKSISEHPPIVICNEAHRFIAQEQMRLIGIEQSTVILEPEGRNTAPAVALAAFEIQKKDDAIMVVLSADHYIPEINAFNESIANGIKAAISDQLVTLGIQPTKAETGYGYIKKGKNLADDHYLIDQFVEKPDLTQAQSYIKTQQYLWNSGMFCFKASVFLNELNLYQPDIYAHCKNAMQQSQHDHDFIRPDKTVFKACPEDSIDYAVMEHTNNASVIAFNSPWSDLGAWSSLWEVTKKDENNNASIGEVLHTQSQGNYVYSQEKLTALLGVENIVVIDTKDALLISHKDAVQDIKQVVNQVKQNKKPLTENHRHVHRPWGEYDSIDQGKRYQVKRITVKPGAKLSLQMHHHRAEHWIVVAGSARVTIGEKQQLLAENQSVYIPIGETHCLENPGKIPLELIEVQSGSYLGEDDIVRFEDQYGRN